MNSKQTYKKYLKMSSIKRISKDQVAVQKRKVKRIGEAKIIKRLKK